MFVAASPEGAQVVPRSGFSSVLRRRKEWFASLGSAGAELVSLEERWLDDRYALAMTRWRMDFGPGREVEVASTFLVDFGGETPAILVYLAHQDLTTLLRERGIVE